MCTAYGHGDSDCPLFMLEKSLRGELPFYLSKTNAQTDEDEQDVSLVGQKERRIERETEKKDRKESRSSSSSSCIHFVDRSIVRCISCGKRGHIECREPPVRVLQLFCCRCGVYGHTYRSCSSYHSHQGISLEDPGSGRRRFSSSSSSSFSFGNSSHASYRKRDERRRDRGREGDQGDYSSSPSFSSHRYPQPHHTPASFRSSSSFRGERRDLSMRPSQDVRSKEGEKNRHAVQEKSSEHQKKKKKKKKNEKKKIYDLNETKGRGCIDHGGREEEEEDEEEEGERERKKNEEKKKKKTNGDLKIKKMHKNPLLSGEVEEEESGKERSEKRSFEKETIEYMRRMGVSPRRSFLEENPRRKKEEHEGPIHDQIHVENGEKSKNRKKKIKKMKMRKKEQGQQVEKMSVKRPWEERGRDEGKGGEGERERETQCSSFSPFKKRRS
ncbi:hypothetical protein CSUI_005571 [Cystoisospora suis]|uniref:Uncharacterized protein n=1 Tax=Cystoisospora suis TaxID=483139 RepID=A0A2C6KX43_9APIC|nr:hypothetical protein CSUI_005571 [Cystoisospora suis]